MKNLGRFERLILMDIGDEMFLPAVSEQVNLCVEGLVLVNRLKDSLD